MLQERGKRAGFASIGKSIQPFLRILRGVKDRIDVNGFALNAVENDVWELPHNGSARLLGNGLECFRTACNGSQALFHALKKHVAQAGLLVFVPLVGLLDIAFGRRQQDRPSSLRSPCESPSGR